MMIIDGHVHVFPYLGEACGWESVSAHIAFMQRAAYGTAQLAVAAKDAPLPDVNFRVGKFGRLEWTEGGLDYYRQQYPPSLQKATASPEFMLVQMEHAGIDMAVLQNDKLYGKLNDYFAECVRKYPDRFVGLAEINELEADNESEISKLRHAIKQLGLKGIYYDAARFWQIGNPDGFNDKRFDLFWQEVSDLGVTVFWKLAGFRVSVETFMNQMRVFSVWADRFPDIPSIVVHGLFAPPFKQNDEVRFPKELLDIFKKLNVFAEILYPIQVGPLGWDYPFPQAQLLIKQEYEEFGAHKLIWGSDMPIVERNCTYKQSLSYLKDYCDFINPKEMELVLGGNVARLLNIQTDIPRTPRPKLATIA
jgi:predicted TIM-barrel fold metal-dependent hydrolase